MEPALPRLPRRVPARPLTVAELVMLHGGPPGEPTGVQGPPVSVGSLLRREGRARHAFDRPVVPRGHDRPPERAPARPGGRRATAATGAVLMVGAVLGTAVVNESVVARPLTTPDTGSAAPAGGTPVAAGHPARAARGADRPVTMSYVAPMAGAVRARPDLPVASGASIGRAALGGSAAWSPPAPADRHPPAGAIPRPRTPADSAPPAVAALPAVVFTPAAPGHGLGPVDASAVAVPGASITAPAGSSTHPRGARIGPAEIVPPQLGLGAVQALLPDVAGSRAPAAAARPPGSPAAVTAPDPAAAGLPVVASVTATGRAVGGLLGR